VSSGERIKKPKLERTRPMRSWSTLFDVPGGETGQANSEPGPAARQDRSVSLNDVVSRSVDLGYRVVDEYLRRGQQAARRINERSYDVQAMTGDVQDLGVRTLQYVSDFAALWLDLLQRAATDSALLRPRGAANSARATTSSDRAGGDGARSAHDLQPAATQRAQPLRVKIEVAAAQPAEVTLDLRPEGTDLQLIVHALRAVDPDKPRVSDVGIRPGADGEPATLWIRVPPGQPAGVYSGVIVDRQSSRPVGTLSLRIAAQS
jgi:hypothetical protein